MNNSVDTARRLVPRDLRLVPRLRLGPSVFSIPTEYPHVAMADDELRDDDSAEKASHLESVERRLRFHAMEVCVSYVVMFLFSAMLLRYTAFAAHALVAGDSSFTPRAILPTFRALLATLATAALALIGVTVGLAVAFSTESVGVEVYLALLYAGRHFLLALAPAFLYQTSLSRAALMRAVLVTLTLTFSAFALFAVPTLSHSVALYAAFGLLTVFFTWMLWRPPLRASHAVLRRYAAFVLTHVVLGVTHVACVDVDVLDAGAPFSSVSSVWTSVTPLFVWYLLKADTAYWRGKCAHTLSLQQRFLATHPKVAERVSADGLHVLLEMHRKHLIDFASLDVRRQLTDRDSGNATVFSGLLRGKVPVSLKVYTPTNLSDEVIAAYSQEVALCGHLAHPNVVRFHGLSVCPPTVSLVFELCRGSLKELSALGRDGDYGCRLLLKTTQMLDAARAIAYLHSFSPPFIHRELTLASFLVDAHGIVKLAGFGDSRVLHQFASGALSPVPWSPWEERTASSPYAAFADTVSEVARKVPFHAPYSERIDVYALGMAFWELLHPRVALSWPDWTTTTTRSRDAAEWRPLVADDVPVELRELLESMWRRDTRVRPTAAQVVRKLEAIQQLALAEDFECAAAAVDPSHLGVVTDPSSEPSSMSRTLVAGADAVRSLVSSNQVQHAWEAVRLGNAWMEAGLLHEERHVLPFQNKASARYYFSPPSRRTTDDATLSDNDDANSVIVIGMSMSTRGSFGYGKYTGVSRAARKRCLCRTHVRHVAPVRRAWHAFATAESRAMAQHDDHPLSSSYESLLMSVLVVDNGLKE